jgi:hypothetical protein
MIVKIGLDRGQRTYKQCSTLLNSYAPLTLGWSVQRWRQEANITGCIGADRWPGNTGTRKCFLHEKTYAYVLCYGLTSVAVCRSRG